MVTLSSTIDARSWPANPTPLPPLQPLSTLRRANRDGVLERWGQREPIALFVGLSNGTEDDTGMFTRLVER